MKKQNEIEIFSGITTLIFSVAASVLFALSYTTNYYTFGQMNSVMTVIFLGMAIAVEIASLIVRTKRPDSLVGKTLTLFISGFLAAASMLLMGDRVEGIGICVITDYDSGHGGEEAIYMSIAASLLMIVAIVYNIVGSFFREKAEDTVKAANKTIAHLNVFVATGLLVLLAIVVPTMVMVQKEKASHEQGEGTTEVKNEKVYTILFSQEQGNAEQIPDYQFLCGNMGMLMKFDSRVNVEISLTLAEDGTYQLVSDAYVVEAGKRAEVGDDTGIGTTIKTTAEGTYAENEDGTITTKKAEHAVVEIETDTYSSQMKDVLGISISGSSEDGVYDSSDYAEILDYVPETRWEIDGDAVVAYQKAAGENDAQESGEEVTENQESPQQQEENANVKAEVASVDGATTLTFYQDGTYLFYFAQYQVEDRGTYTYDGTVLTLINANDLSMEAQGDPLELHYEASQSDMLTGDYSIPAADLK